MDPTQAFKNTPKVSQSVFLLVGIFVKNPDIL